MTAVERPGSNTTTLNVEWPPRWRTRVNVGVPSIISASITSPKLTRVAKKVMLSILSAPGPRAVAHNISPDTGGYPSASCTNGK